MIEMKQDALEFRFPEVHRRAVLRVEFQRTLRIPDDGRDYPLPPGLGRFPLRHVDDAAARVPERWLAHGGVMLPMYQSEALWLRFESPHDYPFAIKVGTGKVDAVTGRPWSDALGARRQDYLVAPDQPWLDGYCVAKGLIRQFVAMPLGSGYSVEEQLTGAAEHGGMQLLVHPLKGEAYERICARSVREGFMACDAMYAVAAPDMGLAPGGRMRQDIHEDPHDFGDWDRTHRGRCFVHLANALVWRAITGAEPPTVPPTAAEYNRAGLPWFEYYDADRRALSGGPGFGGVHSVAQLGIELGDAPLPENESVDPQLIISLRAGLAPGEVRQGSF
jgi:hypothetical protein